MRAPDRHCGHGRGSCRGRGSRRGFTLIELLVVVAIIGVVLSVLLPALAGARASGRSARCLSNLRQMHLGWALYADDYRGYAMPLARFDGAGGDDSVFWWGSAGDQLGYVDHMAGFLSPYLDSALSPASVYECPEQPWGSYRAQGFAQTITSTYGYNGYYLTPAATPGWSSSIGKRPWRRIHEVGGASDLLVFADTLLGGEPASNNALLDPPMLYQGRGRWRENRSPTTAFRHAGRSASGVRADGSARLTAAQGDWIVDEANSIGSIGRANDPAYVPDWREWRE